MKLLSLKMKNFMPYKGETNISFPQNESQNIMVIFGENMRGKTSFFNAIRWCLYGVAIGRHSKTIPLHLLCNKEAISEGDWNFEVRLEFENDGRQFELVRRAIKKKLVALPQREQDVDTTVNLRIDNVPVEEERIVHIINNVAPEPVSRFFLFDGELLNEYEELLTEGSSQGAKIKKSIEQVLGVPALLNGRQDIRVVLNEAQKEQTRELRNVAGLEKLAEDQSRLQAKLEATNADLESLTERRSSVEDEVDRLEEVLAQSQALLEKKATLDALEREKKKFAQTQSDYKEERLEKMRDAWKILVSRQIDERRRELVKKSGSLSERLVSDGALKSEIRNITKILSGEDCPTCKQSIAVDRRRAVEGELAALERQKKEIGNVAAELATLGAQREALERLRDPGTKDRLLELERKIAALEIDGIKVDTTINDILEEIEGKDTLSLERTRDSYKKLVGELTTLKSDLDEANAQIKDTQNKMDANSIQMKAKRGSQSSLGTHKVSICTDIEQIFERSVDILREKLKGRVEDCASQAFKSLTTEKTYRGLKINENYGLTILDQVGEEVAIRSAGAEQIVALSLISGLNSTGRGTGPIIMDTPFGRLDPGHRRNILEFMPLMSNQFILLVHGGELDKERDLHGIADRVASVWEINRVSSSQSKLERSSL